VLPVDAALGHAAVQYVEPLLALAAADDVADPRRQPSSLSFSNAAKVYFSKASAKAALSERSANAISGSIIQNSARWREVFEFSARKVGSNV
jgi:hypothetical protein